MTEASRRSSYDPGRKRPVPKPVQLFRGDGRDGQSTLGESLYQSTAWNFKADNDPVYLALAQKQPPIDHLRYGRTSLLNRAFLDHLATVVNNPNRMRLCRPVDADQQQT